MRARSLALVVLAATGLRVALMPAPGFPGDLAAFASWARALAAVGFAGIYATPLARPAVDYPPLYLYVLRFVGRLQVRFFDARPGSDVAVRVLLKTPAVVADAALVALGYALIARTYGRRRAFAAACAIAFAPPTWLDSAYWGQIDAIPIALSAGGVLFALERRFIAAWALVGLGILVKPQGLVLVPLLLARQLALEGLTLRLPVAAALVAGLAYLTTLPFAPDAAPAAVATFLVGRYAAGVAKAPHVSEGAFNLYTIGGGFYRSDAATVGGIALHAWGIALVAACVGALSLALLRFRAPERDGAPERAFVLAAALALAALFFFATRMHERYLLGALVLGVGFAFEGRGAALAFGALAVGFTVNCAVILAGFSGGAHHPWTVMLGRAFSALDVGAFAVLATTFTRRYVATPRRNDLWRQGDSNS